MEMDLINLLRFLHRDRTWRLVQTAPSFMSGIDGVRKRSSTVIPETYLAWNIRRMGDIWRQE
jgi:hypothetical protein